MSSNEKPQSWASKIEESLDKPITRRSLISGAINTTSLLGLLSLGATAKWFFYDNGPLESKVTNLKNRIKHIQKYFEEDVDTKLQQNPKSFDELRTEFAGIIQEFFELVSQTTTEKKSQDFFKSGLDAISEKKKILEEKITKESANNFLVL